VIVDLVIFFVLIARAVFGVRTRRIVNAEVTWSLVFVVVVEADDLIDREISKQNGDQSPYLEADEREEVLPQSSWGIISKALRIPVRYSLTVNGGRCFRRKDVPDTP
jgi:hypothetical protein